MAKKSKKKTKVKQVKVSNTDDHLGKEIKIACTGADLIELHDLTDFQGKLKVLSDESYEKLKKSILDLGFSFPVAAWKYRNKTFILDAHQRVKTLKKMREEGYFVPKLPVVWIEATDRHEAAKKLLAVTSQFGEVTPDGLFGFMEEFGLKSEDLEDLKFPEIDFDIFCESYFKEKTKVEFDAEINTDKNLEDKSQFILTVFLKNETELNKLFTELTKRDFECKLIM